ncbi:hypothetical protein Veis_0239 [Verminephrobacter eiseniae EF01-2]|uniref:Uncharacterized protein n=1 Tax=Verminephrobacter eiseniae (strain EF01-2) TaxID=391735 RepID=A1WEH3_VEREI|nr:hypothetical protein Veis_0239 [Verminephrobacter eiseniae EF01-2]
MFHCRYRSAALVPLGRVVGVGVFPRLAGPEPDRLRWGRPTWRVRHRQAHRQRRRVAGAPTTSGSEMPVFLVSRHQGQAALAVHAVIGDPDPVAFRIDLDVDSLDIDIGISIGISGARDRFGQSGGDVVAEVDSGVVGHVQVCCRQTRHLVHRPAHPPKRGWHIGTMSLSRTLVHRCVFAGCTAGDTRGTATRFRRRASGRAASGMRRIFRRHGCCATGPCVHMPLCKGKTRHGV